MNFPGYSTPSAPGISPDGKFVVFTDLSIPRRVFVRKIDGAGEWEISSTQGFFNPRWSPQGDFLYYSTARGEIMRHRVSIDPTFTTLGNPETLVILASSAEEIAVHPDGVRLMANSPVLLDADNDLRFIFNFEEQAKRIAPVAREE